MRQPDSTEVPFGILPGTWQFGFQTALAPWGDEGPAIKLESDSAFNPEPAATGYGASADI